MCGIFCVLIVTQALRIGVAVVIKGFAHIGGWIPWRSKYQRTLLLGCLGGVKLPTPVVFVRVNLNPKNCETKLILAILEGSLALAFGLIVYPARKVYSAESLNSLMLIRSYYLDPV